MSSLEVKPNVFYNREQTERGFRSLPPDGLGDILHVFWHELPGFSQTQPLLALHWSPTDCVLKHLMERRNTHMTLLSEGLNGERLSEMYFDSAVNFVDLAGQAGANNALQKMLAIGAQEYVKEDLFFNSLAKNAKRSGKSRRSSNALSGWSKC